MMVLQGLVVGAAFCVALLGETFIAQTPFHAHMMRTLPIQMLLALFTSLALIKWSWAITHVRHFALWMTIIISSMGGLVLGGFGAFDGPFFYSIYMMPVFLLWIPCPIHTRMLGTATSTLGFVGWFLWQQPDLTLPPHLDIIISSLCIIGAACIAQGHRTWRIATEQYISQFRQEHEHVQTLERNADLAKRLRHQTDRVSALAHEVFDARANIARDLHDDTGQLLVGARMELELIEHQLVQDKELGPTQVEHLHGVMHDLEGSIRQMIERLHSQERQHIDLLEELEAFRAHYPLLTRVEIDVDLETLDHDIQHMIYRLIQEGLTNAAKYSTGDQWKISLTCTPAPQMLVVSVLDNGDTILTSNSSKGGWGIPGLSERARSLGGQVELTRKDQSWTALTLTLPLVT